MDSDGDDDEYALRTPAVRRRDTITRQLQREILGDMAAQSSRNDLLDASLAAVDTTPEDAPSASAKIQQEPEQREQKSEEDDPMSRRRTVSPTKAAQLFQDTEALDAAIRRMPDSPVVLRAAEDEEKATAEASQEDRPLKARGILAASELQHLVQSEENVRLSKNELLEVSSARKGNSPEDEVRASLTKSTKSKSTSASKRPRSATKKTSPAKDGRKRASIANTSDSFTDFMFAPNLLEQDAVRRTTLDPTEAASVVAALQKETKSLSRSVLEMDDDSDGNNQPSAQAKPKSPTLSKQVTSKKTPTPSKESKQSPASLKELANSKKSPSPSKSRKSPSPAKEAKGRKSAYPAKEDKGNKSVSPPEAKDKKTPTPTKTISNRRTTLDPSDVLMISEDSSQQQDGRRQTIDINGLLEMTGVETVASRKRANDSGTRGGSVEKRVRANSGDKDETMESMELDSPVHADAKANPSEKELHEAGSSKQRYSDERPPSRLPKPTLFSPPPGETLVRTPLKGILSARKSRRNAQGAVQTTPNKSVNFGPSQGAEFNHGSPSTSMTPMPAKDASRLFPLERASSDEEPDDAETSLNSSILDEADSLDEEEPKEIKVRKVLQLKKSGFDLLESRRSSLMATKSTDKGQRRHSMRGYSPLDARAETRRRRRQTINVTRQASKSMSAITSFTDTEKPTANVQSPRTARNNSFLRANDALETNRMPYADSSASSDAGEDMEITGDYSIVLGRDSGAAAKPSAPSGDLPRDEDTAEFSLGHLLAESSLYELTKSAPEPGIHDLPGSLSDLANEVADAPSSQSSQVTNATHRLNDQEATLDPIQEANETTNSSRNQSTMSLVSDDSDEEYAANRASLQVNLKSQFDRVSEPSHSPRRPATPESLSVHLITMEELLSSVALNEEDVLVESGDDFFNEEDDSSENQVSRNVKLACAHDTCSEVIERHAQDVSAWSSAVAEELSSLLHIKAPAVFSPEKLDDAGREAIHEVYAIEALVARTVGCQLQAQLEQQLASSLSQGADALASDVKSLKDSVVADALKRQNELAAIREMIDREEQMALLLDAIEEQQGVHDEYVKAVKDLEKECSSLSLEESVLQSRLKVLEGRAAELEPVTSTAATLFEEEVLATEEMLAIQESMSLWKIREATASILRLSARFEDVLFHVEICVDVHLGSPSMGGTSTSIRTNESLKRREGNTYLPYEGDVVLVLQRLLLNPLYISRIANESELGDGNDGRVCSKVQVLEHVISRSCRLLKELRELSTQFAMRYDEDDSTLWIDFLKFPSVASRMDIEGAQFSVGFSLLPVFPYTDYQTAVQVPYGQVSTDAVAKEIEQVSRQEPKYFTRVCRRLYEMFGR